MGQFRIIMTWLLSVAILFAWQYFFPQYSFNSANNTANSAKVALHSANNVNNAAETGEEQALVGQKLLDRRQSIKKELLEKKRVKIENSYIKGSINLKGGLLDDVILLRYRNLPKGYVNKFRDTADKLELADKNSLNQEKVKLLSPRLTENPYFVRFGWYNRVNEQAEAEALSDSEGQEDKSALQQVILPNMETLWTADKEELRAGGEVNLFWINPQGIKFIINFKLSDKYLLTIKQLVNNSSGKSINIASFSTVERTRGADPVDNMMLHEGAIGVIDNKLNEISFDKIAKQRLDLDDKVIDWAGFTDKYWLVSLVANSGADKMALRVMQYKVPKKLAASFQDQETAWQRRYKLDLLDPVQGETKPGAIYAVEKRLFVGAKSLNTLQQYSKQYDIKLFERAVDFGTLYVITKPIFLLLNYFYSILGNFGLAIMLLTIVIKSLLLPLAYKSFVNMRKLRLLAPQIQKIKAIHEKNPVMLQKALSELYKREKVSPVSGCFPVLLQAPVFFALYKVLYITIEMRDAPFFGWIRDLSAPDGTSVFNLFGLLSWHPPKFLIIGILPLLMSLTMFVQQSLTGGAASQVVDETQARIMKMLPLFLLFMFASFPAGLLIYWIWSNSLSIAQQSGMNFWVARQTQGKV